MDIPALYQLYKEKKIISTDSRNITPGCIFFALKGESFNGNMFARQAIEKGADFAVVDEDSGTAGEKIICVNEVLSTLQELAAFHRKQKGFTILAVTGSNGKTTTKELCKLVLSKKFSVYATTGNLNNHIGVPLTLLSMNDNIEAGIIEMGANHPGEIAALCKIASPDYGLITNIGKAHLEGFGGIKGVARAKGELFQYLMNHNKTIFLNEGNSYLPDLVPSDYSKLVYYNGNSDLKALSLSSNPFLKLTAGNTRSEFEISTNLVGRYNAENVLAACAVGLHFGIKPEDIAAAIASYYPLNNRSQLIKTGRNTVYMDAYNANPSSMITAINEFLQLEGQRKLLILGEMREVGVSSHAEHDEIISLLKHRKIDHVLCVGKAFEEIAEKAGYPHYTSVDDLIGFLQKKALQGYLVFVKGSRSNRLEKVITFL